MRDLETRLKTKNVNQNIMSIAIAKNVLLENIMELADREVDGTQTCELCVHQPLTDYPLTSAL